jgi:membrane-associated phospholipid phosphatase
VVTIRLHAARVKVILPLLFVFPLLATEADAVTYCSSFRYQSARISNSPYGSILAIAERGDQTSPGKSPLLRYMSYAAIAAGGATIFAFDKDLNILSQKKGLHGRIPDQFLGSIEHFGREGPYVIATPLLLGHGLIFKNKKSILVGEQLAGGFFLCEGLTVTVKAVFGRKRPYETSSPYQFFEGGSSFYSGHTATAFSFATILSKNFPRQNLGFIGIDQEIPLVPIGLYSMAVLTSLERLYDNYHWASDVYFGCLAGYGLGSLAVHFGKRIQSASLVVIAGQTPVLLGTFHFD